MTNVLFDQIRQQAVIVPNFPVIQAEIEPAALESVAVALELVDFPLQLNKMRKVKTKAHRINIFNLKKKTPKKLMFSLTGDLGNLN